ncbi:hypothetical protein N9002_00890, partial [bacterium]|nr:hypothetical protein [bacterium]
TIQLDAVVVGNEYRVYFKEIDKLKSAFGSRRLNRQLVVFITLKLMMLKLHKLKCSCLSSRSKTGESKETVANVFGTLFTDADGDYWLVLLGSLADMVNNRSNSFRLENPYELLSVSAKFKTVDLVTTGHISNCDRDKSNTPFWSGENRVTAAKNQF